MKRILVSGFIISAILFLFLYRKQSVSTIKTKTVITNGHQIIVEVADTDKLRAKGLSSRVSLAKDSGMLFTFPASSFYRFWMKDMKFPLDFIWIGKDTIVDLTENVQPATSGADLKTFTAKYPFDKVLEVNAGTIKLLNIIIGDTIH